MVYRELYSITTFYVYIYIHTLTVPPTHPCLRWHRSLQSVQPASLNHFVRDGSLSSHVSDIQYCVSTAYCGFSYQLKAIGLLIAFVCMHLKPPTQTSCLLQHQEDGLQQPLQAAQVVPHYSTWQSLRQLPCAPLPPTSHPQARLPTQDPPSPSAPITLALTAVLTLPQTPTFIPQDPLGSQPCPGLSHS